MEATYKNFLFYFIFFKTKLKNTHFPVLITPILIKYHLHDRSNVTLYSKRQYCHTEILRSVSLKNFKSILNLYAILIMDVILISKDKSSHANITLLQTTTNIYIY